MYRTKHSTYERMIPEQPTRGTDHWIQDAVVNYQSQLITYASRIVGDKEQAREVVQDAFLALCRQSESEVGKYLRAWLYRVVRNRSFNLKRKDKRMVHGLGNTHIEQLSGQEKPLTGSGVFELIQTLPPRQSELLMLKFAEGLSYQEISKITGLTPGNVGYILHHAVKTLKNLWEEVEAGK